MRVLVGMVTYFGLLIAFIALLVALIGGTHVVDAAGRRRLAISGWIAGAFGVVGLAAAVAGAYEADMARKDLSAEARALGKSHDELRADLQAMRAQRDEVRAAADRQRLDAEGLAAEVAEANEKLEAARRNEMYLRLQIERQTDVAAAERERELQRIAGESLDLDIEPSWVFDRRLFSGATLELEGFDCSVLIDYGEERAFVRLRPQRPKTILLMSQGPQPFTLSMTRSSGARCKGDMALYQPEGSPIAVLAEEAAPSAPEAAESSTAAAVSAETGSEDGSGTSLATAAEAETEAAAATEAEAAVTEAPEAGARVEPPPLDAAPPPPPAAEVLPRPEVAAASSPEVSLPPLNGSAASPAGEAAAPPEVSAPRAATPEVTAAPAPDPMQSATPAAGDVSGPAAPGGESSEAATAAGLPETDGAGDQATLTRLMAAVSAIFDGGSARNDDQPQVSARLTDAPPEADADAAAATAGGAKEPTSAADSSAAPAPETADAPVESEPGAASPDAGAPPPDTTMGIPDVARQATPDGAAAGAGAPSATTGADRNEDAATTGANRNEDAAATGADRNEDAAQPAAGGDAGAHQAAPADPAATGPEGQPASADRQLNPPAAADQAVADQAVGGRSADQADPERDGSGDGGQHGATSSTASGAGGVPLPTAKLSPADHPLAAQGQTEAADGSAPSRVEPTEAEARVAAVPPAGRELLPVPTPKTLPKSAHAAPEASAGGPASTAGAAPAAEAEEGADLPPPHPKPTRR